MRASLLCAQGAQPCHRRGVPVVDDRSQIVLVHLPVFAAVALGQIFAQCFQIVFETLLAGRRLQHPVDVLSATIRRSSVGASSRSASRPRRLARSAPAPATGSVHRRRGAGTDSPAAFATPSVAPNPASTPGSVRPQPGSACHRPPDRHRPASAQPLDPDMACRPASNPPSCPRSPGDQPPKRGPLGGTRAAHHQPIGAPVRPDRPPSRPRAPFAARPAGRGAGAASAARPRGRHRARPVQHQAHRGSAPHRIGCRWSRGSRGAPIQGRAAAAPERCSLQGDSKVIGERTQRQRQLRFALDGLIGPRHPQLKGARPHKVDRLPMNRQPGVRRRQTPSYGRGPQGGPRPRSAADGTWPYTAICQTGFPS